MWLGPWRSNLDRPLGLDWTNEPVKVLGTFVLYDSVGNERKNFAKKVDNLKTKLSAWHSHKLSLFGRCLILKTLGLPQIVYSASMLDIITHLQSNCYFSRSYGKTNQIKSRDKSYIRTMTMVVCGSLMLKLCLSPCAYFNAYFNKYGGLNVLLRSNYDKKFLKDSDIPSFYKDILFSFLDLKSLEL